MRVRLTFSHLPDSVFTPFFKDNPRQIKNGCEMAIGMFRFIFSHSHRGEINFLGPNKGILHLKDNRNNKSNTSRLLFDRNGVATKYPFILFVSLLEKKYWKTTLNNGDNEWSEKMTRERRKLNPLSKLENPSHLSLNAPLSNLNTSLERGCELTTETVIIAWRILFAVQPFSISLAEPQRTVTIIYFRRQSSSVLRLHCPRPTTEIPLIVVADYPFLSGQPVGHLDINDFFSSLLSLSLLNCDTQINERFRMSLHAKVEFLNC